MSEYVFTSAATTYMKIDCPLEGVVLTKVEGVEALSTPFDFHVEMVSKKNDLDFSSIVGKSATLSFINTKGTRYINGMVTEFRQGLTRYSDSDDEQTLYYARLQPSLFKMQLSENCAIFQDKSVMDIVKALLGDASVTFEDKVSSAGQTSMDFCAQFNESNFAFMSRLLEQEGIYYFFKHADGAHTMILADAATAISDAEDSAPQFVGPWDNEPDIYGITECGLKSQVFPASFAVKDFNFETPDTDLYATTAGKGLGGDMYRYPGHYSSLAQSDGETISKTFLESTEASGSTIAGKSTVPFLLPGFSFSMKDHPRSSLNGQAYAVEKVRHYAELKENMQSEDVQTAKDDTVRYENHFEGFLKTINYRPPRKTPWPHLTTQTAIVTGKEEEEIWTDKYGRVKVKFHWDTSDTANEKTSCWVRVMQAWAGNQWGTLFIPRVGQEVVIQFLNGDPSTPLITGAVYNNTNMPPYLPGEPTKSTIKTNSTKEGEGGYNELRFDDDKGNEELYMHAQKDMNTIVEADQTLTLNKGNRTVTLTEGDYSRTLTKGNETITLSEGDYSETLTKGDYSLTLSEGKRDITVTGGDETHTNDKNYTHSIKGNYELDVDGNYTCKVKGNGDTTIDGNASFTVKGNLTLKVTGKVDIESSAGITVKSDGNLQMNASSGMTCSSNANISMTGNAGVTISSGASLSLSGGASTTLSGGASCSITGATVSING